MNMNFKLYRNISFELTSKAWRYPPSPVIGEAYVTQIIGFGIHSSSSPASRKAAVEASAAPRLMIVQDVILYL